MSNKQSLEFKITLDGKEAVGTIDLFAGKVKSASDKIVSGFENARDVFQGLEYTINTLNQTFGAAFQSYRDTENSFRKLTAASKLTGNALGELEEVSNNVKESFSLSKTQANEFTIVVSKLTQKAGDFSKTQSAIAALLDIGAGQGLSAEQALTAINQALLGIDEGTDKLFQKNPSVIYDAYAKSIGTTAGKLDDQQKAQALLNEVLTVGNKLTGSYSDYLKEIGGSTDQFKTKLTELASKAGEFIAVVITPAINGLNKLIDIFQTFPGWVQGAIVTIGLLTAAIIALNVTGLTASIQAMNMFILSFMKIDLAATIAAGGIRGFFASLGPIGWAIFGITSLVTVMGLLGGETEKVKGMNDKFIESLQQSATEFRERIGLIKKAKDEVAEFEKKVKESAEKGKKPSNANGMFEVLPPPKTPVLTQIENDVSNLGSAKKVDQVNKIKSYSDALKEQEALSIKLSQAIIRGDESEADSLKKKVEELNKVITAYETIKKINESKITPLIEGEPIQNWMDTSIDTPAADSPISGEFLANEAQLKAEAEIEWSRKSNDEKIRLIEAELKAEESNYARQVELQNQLHDLYVSKKMEEFDLQREFYKSLTDTAKEFTGRASSFLVEGFTKGFKNIENSLGKFADQLSQIFFTQLFNKLIGAGVDLLLKSVGIPITPFASGGVVRAGNPVVGVVGEAGQDEVVMPKEDLITFFRNEVVPKIIETPQFDVAPATQRYFTPEDFKSAIESANIEAKSTRREALIGNYNANRLSESQKNR